MSKLLNWKPDILDERDFKSVKHIPLKTVKLPESFSLESIPVYDQGNIGSCTANSVCTCYRYEKFQIDGNFLFEPSRLFQYYTTRIIEGTECCDEGASIRNVMKALNKYGVCSEKTVPYNEKKFAEKPSDIAFIEAENFKSLEYSRVEKNIKILKQTIYSGAVITFGFYVYENFMEENWQKLVAIMPKPAGELLGGHAVTAIGWDDSKESFLIQNSWGKNWGLYGLFWMPYDFIISENAMDFWIINKISHRTFTEEELIVKKIITNKTDLYYLKENVLKNICIVCGIKIPKNISRINIIKLLVKKLML